MVWVVVLVLLAIAVGGVGLLIDALQFLLVVAVILVLIALAVGFWVRSRVADALGGGSDHPTGSAEK